MKAVLLAAGAGTRLLPLTIDVPKILVRAAGLPLLEHQLRYLRRQGVTEVAINVHHHADQVERYLDGSDADVTDDIVVHLYREETLQGTAGALLPMRDFLDEPFVVLYGDVVTDLDLGALLRSVEGKTMSIAYTETRESGGYLELAPEGWLRRFEEKPTRLRSAGVYALDPRVLGYIWPGDDFGEHVLPLILTRGAWIEGFRTNANVIDVGTHKGLATAEAFLW